MGGMKSSGTLMTAEDSPQLYDSSVCVRVCWTPTLCVCVCVYLRVRMFINAYKLNLLFKGIIFYQKKLFFVQSQHCRVLHKHRKITHSREAIGTCGIPVTVGDL